MKRSYRKEIQLNENIFKITKRNNVKRFTIFATMEAFDDPGD